MRAGLLVGLALLGACSKGPEPVAEASSSALPETTASVAAAPSEPAVPLVEGKYAPQDECTEFAGAADFRKALQSAVSKRDAAALAALAAPDIVLDFGGGAGREELKKRLSGNKATDDLWAELDEILPLGCAARDSGLTVPWMAAQDYGDDTFEVMLVTGGAVPLYGMDLKTPLRTLSWTTVKPLSGLDFEKPMRKVQASDGTQGFVKTRYLRSPIDYRLAAERKDGKWQITAFVAGD